MEVGNSRIRSARQLRESCSRGFHAESRLLLMAFSRPRPSGRAPPLAAMASSTKQTRCATCRAQHATVIALFPKGQDPAARLH